MKHVIIAKNISDSEWCVISKDKKAIIFEDKESAVKFGKSQLTIEKMIASWKEIGVVQAMEMGFKIEVE